MDFTDFKNNINQLSNFEIGGIDTQFKLAPKIRSKYTDEFVLAKNPKTAAVLALFYPNEYGKTYFLLTKRAQYKGTHSSQISFPGGKFEENDKNLQYTALRETYEEVGIHQSEIHVFKQMTNVYIPPSNFLVTPFLGILNTVPTFTKNHEVADIINVLVSEFLCNDVISSENIITSNAEEMIVPCYKLNNYTVWGATAMMLSEIRELIEKL
ncbi:MAG: CoA pyrophosphatase [Lutibacter sp.]|nr:CoA pyrophosphatase [Lutibacter sp.]MBP9601766.1 CoA pyrophosphatase [Lutibacter sp.]